MNLLDIRTVIISYIISNGLCAVVIGSLWFQDRRRSAGLGLWLADFVAQFVALLLITLRGRIPDFISATVSNALIIGGTILLYIGLEQFVGKPSKQIHNVILLAVFIFVHAYFILVFPSLDVRTIILSLGLLVICLQCAWLMLHRVDAEMRSITSILGVVFLAFCLISLVRIFVDLIVPPGNDFFHSDSFDTSLVLAYQMAFIILALSLFLMVNRQLVAEFEHDILMHKQTEATIANLAKFPSENPNPIMRVNGNGIVLYTNPAAILLLDSLDSAIDRPMSASWQTLIMQTLASQVGQTIEIEHAGRVFECELVPIREGGYVNLYARDITERKRMEQELQKLSRTVEQSPSSILITDKNGTIEYANPAFTQLTGYSMEEVLGQNPRILKSGRTPPEIYRQLWETLTLGKEFRAELVNKKRNGELYYERRIISPITDSRGVITHYLAVGEDVTVQRMKETEIQSLQAQLREQAVRDPLTGLYNRRYLDEILERELARAQRETSPISFAMIDIDHFKQINDSLGHAAGDALLKKLAGQILNQVRTSDIICRFGGDEFLVILPSVTAEISFQVAERWRRSFMDSTLPLEYGRIKSTISCGISEYPVHGKTSDKLIAAADRALYQAKTMGRNQVVILAG